MSTPQDFEKDLADIRRLMERSTRFISFSGLAGILAGIYALAGSAAAYFRLPPTGGKARYLVGDLQHPGVMSDLVTIASVVLVASLVTGWVITAQRAKRLGVSILDEAGRTTMINLAIPLATGGVFVLLLLAGNHYELVAPVCLIFYGLALVHACHNLYDEVRYLGYLEILLGLAATAVPGYGLYAWALGFGVLHILYGAILFRKYEA